QALPNAVAASGLELAGVAAAIAARRVAVVTAVRRRRGAVARLLGPTGPAAAVVQRRVAVGAGLACSDATGTASGLGLAGRAAAVTAHGVAVIARLRIGRMVGLRLAVAAELQLARGAAAVDGHVVARCRIALLDTFLHAVAADALQLAGVAAAIAARRVAVV